MITSGVIGLAGPPGAGKDTLVEQLELRGVGHFYAGGVIRDRAKVEGFVPSENTREAYLPFWQQVADDEGRDWLAKSAQAQALELGRPVVFNGLRISDDAQRIIKDGGSFLWMHGEAEELYERVINRSRADDSNLTTFTDYLRAYAGESREGVAFRMADIAQLAQHYLLPVEHIEDPVQRTARYAQLANYVINLAD